MKLLVVEDNKDARECLRDSLAEEGFQVDTAEDGDEGLQKALTENYDLILLDLNLPKKDGSQVCAELRKARHGARVIMLTVRSAIDTKVNLLNIGADDYLTKPFSFDELNARIKALLRRPTKMEDPTVLKVRDLSLDKLKRSVKRGRKTIILTEKEYELLGLLMRRKGELITSEDIAGLLWSKEPLNTAGIGTHVYNLRLKIEQVGKPELIHTVYGRGYMLG